MASRNRVDLLSNASATGDWKKWPGGRGSFMVEGTFDSATVKLQMKAPNGSAIDVGSYTTLTANGVGNFEIPTCDIRAAVTGGSAPAGLYATAVDIVR